MVAFYYSFFYCVNSIQLKLWSWQPCCFEMDLLISAGRILLCVCHFFPKYILSMVLCLPLRVKLSCNRVFHSFAFHHCIRTMCLQHYGSLCVHFIQLYLASAHVNEATKDKLFIRVVFSSMTELTRDVQQTDRKFNLKRWRLRFDLFGITDYEEWCWVAAMKI